MNKLVSLIKNTALIAGSIVLSLGLLELLLPFLHNRSIEESVYEIRRPVIQFQYGAFHPQLKYTLQANLKNIRQHYPGKLDYTVDTNREGFRGDDWDMSPARRNILVLGDSFAFGWGVSWQETVGEKIEVELHKIDPAYQVINLAQSGYSIKEVVNSYQHFKEQLKPEAIIYIFCQNDLESYAPPTSDKIFAISYQPEDNAREKFAEMIAHNQANYWSWDKFRRGSHLHAFYARFVRPLLSKRIRDSLNVDKPPEGFDFPPPIKPSAPLAASPEKEFLYFCLDKMANDFNGPLYILDTSDKSDLFRKDSELSKRWLLKEYSDGKKNVHFINFENYLRSDIDSKKYFLDYDDHWSAAGHARAAALLLEQLRENNI